MLSFNRLLHLMTHFFIISFYALLVVISYAYFDRALASYFHHYHLREQLKILYPIILLGKWQLPLIFLTLMTLYVHFKHPNPAWRNKLLFLLLCVLITNAIAIVLKIVLGRARPDLYFDSHLYGFFGFKFHRAYWSIPSGHTTTAFSLAAGLAILFPRYIVLFLIAAFAIASTRILMYHHYLSDVLFTLYLTILEVGLLHWVLQKRKILLR